VTPGEAVQRYMAGRDVILDRHLLPYDVEATIAHVRGLRHIGALSEADESALCEALGELAGLLARGEFELDERFEDGHTAIESFLTDRLGDAGRQVHLGRSRNDQVLTAIRLFERSMLDRIGHGASAAAGRCLEIAERERGTVMPGYSHLQRAVPSTVGLWMAGFAEGLLDGADLLRLVRDWLNACPLGAAAGYGVNAPLPRELACEALHFDRLLVNPLHAQNSRGQHDLQALSACWGLMQTIRRLAWDMSLFGTAEFGFLRLGESVTTGSSIMPNKRNPDLAELMRGAAAIVAGAMTEVQQVLALPSGYHRDLQLTKEPIIRALTLTLETVELVPTLLDSIELDREAMRAAIDSDMFATDRAVEMSLRGVPFRVAYRHVAVELKAGRLTGTSPEASIQARVSPGACADLRLDDLRARLKSGES
jgi:argininosuccinate lyase